MKLKRSLLTASQRASQIFFQVFCNNDDEDDNDDDGDDNDNKFVCLNSQKILAESKGKIIFSSEPISERQ